MIYCRYTMLIEFHNEWIYEFLDCKKESCFRNILASLVGGECEVCVGILTIDILVRRNNQKIAIEVKYLRNRREFYRGIGQALAYKVVLGLPTILVQFYEPR